MNTESKTIVCPKCKAVLPAEGTRFCDTCGTEITGGDAMTPTSEQSAGAAGGATAVPSRCRLPGMALVESLNDGRFFHRGFYVCLLVGGALVVAIMAFRLFAGFFGTTGYYATLVKVFDDAPFFGVRSIVATALTLTTSLAGLAGMFWIILRRATEMRHSEYQGLTAVLTRVIKLTGEVIAVVPLVAGTNLFISLLFLARPLGIPFERVLFTPFNDIVEPMITGIRAAQSFLSDAGMGWITRYLTLSVLGGLLAIVCSALLSFAVLVAYYWVAEVIGIIHGFLIHRPMFSRQGR